MSASQNHRTRWTQAETAFLMAEFDHTRETTEIIAELLERSADAVQQRFYQIQWGTAPDALQAKPLEGETHIASAAYRSVKLDDLTVATPVCPNCFTHLPLTLSCDDCS